MTSKQKSLVGGISVLGLAGLACKVVGVLYRIPLVAYIGGEGLGLYQKVFSSYNLLLTVSSAGIPVAISRMVAYYVTRRDGRTAARIFRVALLMLAAFGAAATLLLILGSDGLARIVGAEKAKAGYIAIAPSLFLVCVMSAFRGYMQGHQRMLPTAISQLIEQVGKVALALPFAVIGMDSGGPAWGAAGAMFGTSVAEGAALAYMMIAHVRAKKAFAAALRDPADAPTRQRRYRASTTNAALANRLVRIAVPITIGACIVPLAGLIDSFMLTGLMERGGMAQADALVRFGLYSGMVITLINVPTALAMAMSANLVPDIAAGLAQGDTRFVASESATGLRLAAVVGLPCAVGMSLLARPILYMFYSASYTAAQLDVAAQLLTVSALTIALFTMVQATSGILQGCMRQRVPMYTLAAGVACKVALNYILVGVPSINIHGAPVASLVCYAVSMAPNLYFVAKYTGCKLSVGDLLAKPLASCAVMGGVVMVLWRVVFTEKYLRLGRGRLAIAVFVCVAAGMAAYVLCAWLLKAIRREDLPARFRKKPRRHGR